MLLLNRNLLVAGFLLLTGVQALPTIDFDTSSLSLSKRAVTWDANCNKKYGTKTAKEWLQKSWNTIEPLSQAGYDGLENIVKLIEFKAGISTVDPKISETEQLRLVPLYEIMFGEIEKDAATKVLNKADVAMHVTRANVMMESLKRLEAVGKNRKPNLSMHCDDDFLQTKDLKNKPYSGPAASAGKVWRFNTDTKAWEQYTNNGRVCIGQNAGVTFIKKAGQTTAETMVICPAYFEIQATLEKKDQLHLWELNRESLPEKYWNMGEDRTDDFHMAAFGRKIGMKLFHEMMHTSFFHPTRNYFKDQILTTGSKTGQKAYTFVGAAQLASENKELAAKNIDNVVYWSIANYFEKYHWETGYARFPGTGRSKDPEKEPEAEKSAEKRDPRRGRSGGGRGGSGGGLGAGSKFSTKKNDLPASTLAPASTPAPVSTPPPASTAAPPPASSHASPVPSSSNQGLSSSQTVPSSSSTTTSSPLPSSSASASTASVTSAPNTITTPATQTTQSTISKPCTGTLCTSTASRSSSSSTGKAAAITLSPEPISADDVKIAAASKAEASVQTWEAAGAGVLALWGLNEVLSTEIGEVGTGTASAGIGLPTAGAKNGTFSVVVKPRSTVVPRMEGDGQRSSWMRFLF